jgi:ketopantoate reductase PanE/ApbA-like protein
VEGVRRVTVRLGDHCAAEEIEAAVNDGRPFSEAFPGEGAGSLAALRLTFLRKGFLSRQQRLLRELREAGCSPAVICALRLGEVSVQDDTILIRQPGCAPVKGGAAEILQRYLERLAELGLDCSLAAPLIVDLEGEALSVERLLVHYETARTIRVAMDDDPDLLALYEAALRETVAVGLAEGVRLPSDSVDKTLAMMHSMPPHHITSMGNDLLRGNRLELPWFAGKVIELGRRHGISTPVNRFIFAALKPYINGAPA